MIEFDLDDEFETFMQKVNPEVKETEVQYRESRRVFWAGAGALFLHITREVPNLSDREAFAELKRLQGMFDEFFKKRVGYTD